MPSPQRIRIAKVRSVLLIVFALAVLSVLMYLLFGGNPFRPDVAIRVVVADSGGMPPGSPVRLNGITIGKVESVELAAPPQGDRIVAIIMSIEAGALEFIPEDSMAEIGADNLLGDRLIDITAGRSPVPIRRGGTLRYEPPTEIDQAQVMASLEKNLRRVDALLDDIEMGRGSLEIEREGLNIRREESALNRELGMAGLDIDWQRLALDQQGAIREEKKAVLAGMVDLIGAQVQWRPYDELFPELWIGMNGRQRWLLEAAPLNPPGRTV